MGKVLDFLTEEYVEERIDACRAALAGESKLEEIIDSLRNQLRSRADDVDRSKTTAGKPRYGREPTAKKCYANPGTA